MKLRPKTTKYSEVKRHRTEQYANKEECIKWNK